MHRSSAVAPAPRQVRIALIRGVHEDKKRPCILLRVEPDRALVIYGQSKDNGQEAIAVRYGTPLGVRCGINGDTYFRKGNVVWVKRALLEKVIGTCPATEFMAASKFADASMALLPQSAAATPPEPVPLPKTKLLDDAAESAPHPPKITLLDGHQDGALPPSPPKKQPSQPPESPVD